MNKKQIIEKIRKILAGVDDSLEDDDRLAMVKGYWEAGELVTEYRKATGLRLKDIAREIDIPLAMTQRYSQFYRAFPKGYSEKYFNKVVTWTYIVCVLPVHNAKAREFYLKEACRQGWNRFEFLKRVREDHYNVVKLDEEAGKSKTLKNKGQKLYTYSGEVIKVVDGDTLDLEIDVGFKIRQEHRVRFRGINCPEIGTPEGQKSKEFVVQELNRCIVDNPLFKGTRANRPLVVVKTFKQGVFGRYIVDLYYLPGEINSEVIARDGVLLNQVLINKKLAWKVE